MKSLLVPWLYAQSRTGGGHTIGLHVSRFYDGTYRIELGFWWYSLIWLTNEPEEDK
jgi:hypothetical protein